MLVFSTLVPFSLFCTAPFVLRFHLVPFSTAFPPSAPISNPTRLLFHRLLHLTRDKPRRSPSAILPPVEAWFLSRFCCPHRLVLIFVQISPLYWCSLVLSLSPLLLLVLSFPVSAPSLLRFYWASYINLYKWGLLFSYTLSTSFSISSYPLTTLLSILKQSPDSHNPLIFG